ncbi:MAG: adenine deaminase [Desulfobacteraceae bacterium]|nr:adenine deaminase [Desulfobacteraceae bacterium]
MTAASTFPRLSSVARGEQPADLLLRNARLINVFNATIVKTDVAVADGRVVGVGPYEALTQVDLENRFLAPGFIDAHVHIESAMVAPAQFAKAVVTHGTTAVVADPHEIANVLGTTGIDYMLEASEQLPVHFFFTLPSCVPATHMETSGANLDASALSAYVQHPRIVALAEMMNFPGVIFSDERVLAKIALMKRAGKPLDGHAPGLSGRGLSAYLLPGIASDHECTSTQEAEEKLSMGMHIMIREGTGARNLDQLLPIITPQTARRMMWCTDDRHPQDLLGHGHIDQMLRRAVRAGVDPLIAIQIATLNPAEYFRVNDVGAVAPGRWADFAILDDLSDPVVRQVYCRGRLVAQDGQLLNENFPEKAVTVPSAMRVPLERLNLRIPAQGPRVRVIESRAHQIITGSSIDEPFVIEGNAESDPRRDLLKIAVIERHHGTGRAGLGFIRGFGLQRGALASSVAHDSHNIIVVGCSDQDMQAAVSELATMGGGLVVVENGILSARLPLPLAGLMSDQPMAAVQRELEDVLQAARRLGCRLPDPFMTLSFMALPVIPALKITDRGLVDVEKFAIVQLFLE